MVTDLLPPPPFRSLMWGDEETRTDVSGQPYFEMRPNDVVVVIFLVLA